jgi:pullulanase
VPGSIQSVLGCDADWMPDGACSALVFDAEDGVWSNTFTLPAGDYEYKVAINGSWAENYGGMADAGGGNITLSLTEETAVTFIYDHATKWVADSVNKLIVTAPGSYQEEIGCSGDWKPDCLRSWLQDIDGDKVYTMSTNALPAGEYEVKAAINQSWDVNYGVDGAPNGGNIAFTVASDGATVNFAFNASTNVLAVGVGEAANAGAAVTADLSKEKAVWVDASTIAWKTNTDEGTTYFLSFSAESKLAAGTTAITGGQNIPLTLVAEGLTAEQLARFPHLADYAVLRVPEGTRVAGLLKMQTAVSAISAEGMLVDATGMQIAGALDALYDYSGPLGVTYGDDGVPTIRVWAPTARRVSLVLFADSNPATEGEKLRMTFDDTTGVWSITGAADWTGKYYLYEVEVYTPVTNAVVKNLVTDPYSVSLAINSTRSQIIDINSADLLPEGWDATQKPTIEAPEDIVIYELHVRDFSVNDPSVPAELRGTFAAFTVLDSNGMQHLRALAEAGVTHIHLLPTFDIATIQEDKSLWQSPDNETLAGFAGDSEEQQALINETRDLDGFNWGYDPYHFNTPEGSYSTNADGTQRILEFRQMVVALNSLGLNVVTDVVYNHTNAAGQSERSVFDRIVPGYYHRLNASGGVETSTCCQNTATENEMMGRFMVDSFRFWATAYRVDGFRVDLMGHHMLQNMVDVRTTLDSLTLAADGVDGRRIYVYGEGWNFGEVANDARGVNARQLNMGGTGIGTFTDRLRDAVRGGNPFGGWQDQGFANGLVVAPNGLTSGDEATQTERLLLLTDTIKVGLAGNLRDFTFVNAAGETVSGADILYGGGDPAGYALDPQETITYVSAHDNETIFDSNQMKLPQGTSMADRVRVNTLSLSFVAFSQGVAFFHAGDDILRSKSLDRNSYNSGDWYNQVDWTLETGNWAIGMPPAEGNQDNWPIFQPLLADPTLAPTMSDRQMASAMFRELIAIRRSSLLFRLRTAEDINQRVSFLNNGPDQQLGLIVMRLDDTTGADLDPQRQMIVVLFNANDEAITFGDSALAEMNFTLHEIQANGVDTVVQTAAFADGVFSIPARTVAVFVVNQEG